MTTREVFVLLLLCAIILLTPECQAHTLGLHGLSGENPMGDPELSEIRGAFVVALDVRFYTLTNKFQSIFHWTDNDGDESIYFGHKQSGGGGGRGTKLEVTRDGTTTVCIAPVSLNAEQTYAFRFSVDALGTANIVIDNAVVKSCSNMGIPVHVSRDHYLKTTTLAWNFHRRLQGAISGLRITNAQEAPQHPRESFKFLNLPGQSYGQGFVASFYARFDDLSRNSQCVFDFGNGRQDENIWCGQFQSTNRMHCKIYLGTSATYYDILEDVGSIVAGQFAFWHFGVDADGKYWIEKDGVRVKEEAVGVLPGSVFRRNLLFVNDHWKTSPDVNDMLDGVVLGLRLDRLPAS